MISDDLVKGTFMQGVLGKTADRTRKLQAQAVKDYDLIDTGAMLSAMQQPVNITVSGSTGKMLMPYKVYTRFLDMKRKGKTKKALHPIYNRIIYTQLYGYMLSRLRFGYTDAIRDKIKQNLINSFENGNYTRRN